MPESRQTPSTTRLRLFVLSVLGAVLLLGIGLSVIGIDHWPAPPQIADWLRDFGVWAPVVVIALMVLHCFLPFPAEILALCAGAVFGTITGTVLIWTGAMLGAVLSFALARRLGQSFVHERLGARHAANLNRWTENWGTRALLISRFIPLIAFNLINYAAGLTEVRIRTFLWTTAIGILPVTLLSVWLGAQMRDLTWPVLLAVSAAGIAAICCGHAAARWRGWV